MCVVMLPVRDNGRWLMSRYWPSNQSGLLEATGPLLLAWCTTFPRRLKRWTLRWNLLLGTAAYRSYTQSSRQNLQLLSPILVPCGPPDQDWYAEICIRSMMGLRPRWNKHLLWRHQRRELNLILNQCVCQHSPGRQWLVIKMTDDSISKEHNELKTEFQQSRNNLFPIPCGCTFNLFNFQKKMTK